MLMPASQDREDHPTLRAGFEGQEEDGYKYVQGHELFTE